MQLEQLKKDWIDEPNYHASIHEIFIGEVNNNPTLKAHRDYVETNVWGFGERSFWWMWKLLCDELPTNFSFLEIGCFKGATLSVIKLLRPDAKVFGITPLDATGIDWEDDYEQLIKDIHDKFELAYPFIVKRRSDHPKSIETASAVNWDIVYVDGGHLREDIDNDLKHYAPLVQHGGYLVIDDACCDMKMPWGYFQGIKEVTDATLLYITDGKWEFVGNVVHLRIYKRK